MMTNSDCYPFLYGATAHLPARKKSRSAFVIIDIGQHPILFSRAISTLQPDEKSEKNDAYLRECKRICESTCPILNSEQFNIFCKRLSLIRAIAESADQSEIDVNQWAEILHSGLCRPVIY